MKHASDKEIGKVKMETWKKAKLGEITDSSLGKMLDKEKNKGQLQPYLANWNVRWGYFDLDNLSLMKFEDSEDEKYGLNYGDIIICEGGEPGRCAIWKNQIPKMKIQKALHRVRCHKNIDNFFLFYQLLILGKNKIFDQFTTGSTIKHIPAEQLKKVPIVYPPLPTQQKIASILSAYDNLIQNYKKQIEALQTAASELYKEWFVRFRFPGWQNAKFENGIPEGWKQLKLSDIANVIMGQSPESCFYNDEKKGLPFHQGAGSYGDFYLVDDIYSTQGLRIAEPGSIIFSVRAPVGKMNITLNKIILGRGVAAINSKTGKNGFLYWLLKNKFSKEDMIGNGSVFASVTKDELLKQKFLIPPENIIDSFDQVSSNIEKRMRTMYKQITNLTQQRDLLLPRLMSGKLEV